MARASKDSRNQKETAMMLRFLYRYVLIQQVLHLSDTKKFVRSLEEKKLNKVTTKKKVNQKKIAFTINQKSA